MPNSGSVTLNVFGFTGVGIDEVFSRTNSSGTSSFLTDALGSTIALADASGTVQTN